MPAEDSARSNCDRLSALKPRPSVPVCRKPRRDKRCAPGCLGVFESIPVLPGGCDGATGAVGCDYSIAFASVHNPTSPERKRLAERLVGFVAASTGTPPCTFLCTPLHLFLHPPCTFSRTPLHLFL